MGRKGLIITEQGVDIEHAPDFKKVYDSSWPILEISHEMLVDVVIDLANDGNDHQFRYPILKHDLGFKPAVSYIPSDLYDAFGSGHPFHDTGFHSYDIAVDETYVYLTALFLAFELPILLEARGYLRVFDYNPRIEFKAPISQVGGDTRQSRYGIKVLKNSSTSLRDNEFSKFSLNSRAKALTIHQSGIASANAENNFTATIKHDLGYFPSYMLFNTDGGPSVAVRQFGDQNQLHFNGVQGIILGDFPYIVFKDPILEQAK